MSRYKLNLVDGKRVAIILSTPHTYHVRFVKTGKLMEIKKDYLKTVYVDVKAPKQSSQGKLDL